MSSGLQITMRRRGSVLEPTALIFEEDLKSIPELKEVVVTIRRARSPKHLRFFFAKLGEVIKSGAWDSDKDSLLSYVKIGVGYCVTVIDNSSSMVSGAILAIAETMVEKYGQASDEGRLARFVISIAGPKSYLVPRSIALESIGQDEFNDFDKRTDNFLAERMGIDVDALLSRTKESAGADDPAVVDRTKIDEPLDMRLAGLASELKRHAVNVEALNKAWGDKRQTAEAKALHQQAPEALWAIVEAAKRKALGRLSDEAFDDVANRAINDAMARQAA